MSQCASLIGLDLDRPEVRTFRFELPVHRWRVLFHDGGVIDILSTCSDSRLNEFAFRNYYGKPTKAAKDGERIVGLTNLGPEEEVS